MDFFEFNIGNGSYRCIKLDTIESIELLLDSEYYDEDKRKMVKGGQVIITSFSDMSKYPYKYPAAIILGVISLLVCVRSIIYNYKNVSKEKNKDDIKKELKIKD